MNTIPHPEQKYDDRASSAQSKGYSVKLLNRSKARRFLLWCAKETRTHKYTRVSKETLDTIDAQVRRLLVDHVQRFPSKGETL